MSPGCKDCINKTRNMRRLKEKHAKELAAAAFPPVVTTPTDVAAPVVDGTHVRKRNPANTFSILSKETSVGDEGHENRMQYRRDMKREMKSVFSCWGGDVHPQIFLMVLSVFFAKKPLLLVELCEMQHNEQPAITDTGPNRSKSAMHVIRQGALDDLRDHWISRKVGLWMRGGLRIGYNAYTKIINCVTREWDPVSCFHRAVQLRYGNVAPSFESAKDIAPELHANHVAAGLEENAERTAAWRDPDAHLKTLVEREVKAGNIEIGEPKDGEALRVYNKTEMADAAAMSKTVAETATCWNFWQWGNWRKGQTRMPNISTQGICEGSDHFDNYKRKHWRDINHAKAQVQFAGDDGQGGKVLQMFRIVVQNVVLLYTVTLCGDLPMLHTWLAMASCNYSFWCLHDESDDKRVSCEGKPKRTYYRQCTSAHYDRAFTDDDDGTDIRPAVPFPYKCSHCDFEATDQDSINKEAERCEKMKMEDPGAYEAHVRKHTGVRPGDIPIKPYHIVVTDGLHREERLAGFAFNHFIRDGTNLGKEGAEDELWKRMLEDGFKDGPARAYAQGEKASAISRQNKSFGGDSARLIVKPSIYNGLLDITHPWGRAGTRNAKFLDQARSKRVAAMDATSRFFKAVSSIDDTKKGYGEWTEGGGTQEERAKSDDVAVELSASATAMRNSWVSIVGEDKIPVYLTNSCNHLTDYYLLLGDMEKVASRRLETQHLLRKVMGLTQCYGGGGSMDKMMRMLDHEYAVTECPPQKMLTYTAAVREGELAYTKQNSRKRAADDDFEKEPLSAKKELSDAKKFKLERMTFNLA